jgi:ABC-type sugar transport system ATPase subunit
MIQIAGLDLRQGNFCLEAISLHIPQGAYGILMGPSGCGKTTLLECVAGVRSYHAGHISIGGRCVDGCVPGARDIGYVPQDRALFPGLPVNRQLAFALEIRRHPPEVIARRVMELARLLGLEPLLDRHPSHLSGGEAQRVALGRALAARPRALLLDEPLSNLDVTLHDEMCELLQRLHRETGVTVMQVTHHPGEAERLGTVVFSMENGKVLERIT